MEESRLFYARGKMIQRLVNEYKQYNNLVIGFDFDNTIFDYHNTGCDFSGVINLLKQCKKHNFTLCLYTSETNKDKLNWKVEYCRHFGIEPDYVNESPLIAGSPKPFFSILLDDRAGLRECVSVLDEVLYIIESNNK